MKNFAIALLLIVLTALASYGAFYALNDRPDIRRAARERDALAWMRAEFHLDEAQFAAIKALHAQYGVECGRHCEMIASARRRHAPAAEQAQLEAQCVASMNEHFRKVAALMSPSEGQRYLSVVLPRVASYSHEGSPNLQVQP